MHSFIFCCSQPVKQRTEAPPSSSAQYSGSSKLVKTGSGSGKAESGSGEAVAPPSTVTAVDEDDGLNDLLKSVQISGKTPGKDSRVKIMLPI